MVGHTHRRTTGRNKSGWKKGLPVKGQMTTKGSFGDRIRGAARKGEAGQKEIVVQRWKGVEVLWGGLLGEGPDKGNVVVPNKEGITHLKKDGSRQLNLNQSTNGPIQGEKKEKTGETTTTARQQDNAGHKVSKKTLGVKQGWGI